MRLSRAPWEAEKFADIDPEGFFDFQATRPHVSLDEGLDAADRVARERLLPRADPGADRDAVLLLGVEPNLRWRAFSELIVELARDLEVSSS